MCLSLNSLHVICCFRNDLEYQYEKTAKELDLKRNEVVNLTKEYEQRIKLKEVSTTLVNHFSPLYRNMIANTRFEHLVRRI